jgi:aminopeptidase N
MTQVDDFNMGAMENKSLNIFNSRCAGHCQCVCGVRVGTGVADSCLHGEWFHISAKCALSTLRLVLASPETATDMDYERIEGVVGHE